MIISSILALGNNSTLTREMMIDGFGQEIKITYHELDCVAAQDINADRLMVFALFSMVSSLRIRCALF